MKKDEAISIMKVIVHMLEEKYDTDRVEDAVEMAIKALEQEPRWIPVSEKLPEAYQKVLVTYEEFHWENEPTTYGVKPISFGGIVNFIAWMPLPKPYEPQESEDK